LDEAEILSEETEKAIIDANKALGEKGEIVVVTVKTTGDISLADFTAKIYEKWAIGTAETRTGVLQVLDVGSDYYYTMVGPGYAKIFPEATVLSLNKDNLEDGFSQKNYDAGVTKMVAAYAKKIADAPAEDVPTAKKEEGGFWSAVWGFIKVVLLIIVILLVLAVGFFILVNVRAQKRRKQRRSAGRTGSGRTTGRTTSRTTGRTPQERTGRRR
ncbi:MAG: TPM domain-containing protein, partial [Oscillospiraceae bacterium]